jgi:predicted GIY-YIG superfamily endonuclease
MMVVVVNIKRRVRNHRSGEKDKYQYHALAIKLTSIVERWLMVVWSISTSIVTEREKERVAGSLRGWWRGG